ncbi:DUF721 domain-containing protein [Kordiimonas pumila]|uniref:DUF721 domain-containing protein n=1 Tax=Kordiimonas pumila TaxID=2161677 RepID=A0ABV7D8E8_9PROT|nr:DciA family protein [Kordiimonas pumila]
MAVESEKKAKTKKQVPRLNKTTAASKVALAFISPAIRAKGFAQAEVVTRWPHIVGAELAACTVPVQLLFPRGQRMGAKLVVRCESAFAPLLQHKSHRVIEQVNRFFGYGAVASLEVKQGPLHKVIRKTALTKKRLSAPEQQKLDILVGEKDLSPLQQALKSLGEMVLSNKKE